MAMNRFEPSVTAHDSPHEEPAPTARSLIESAYRQLRMDIISGRHPAGEKLRVEHLKETYGVGGSTLREALALLVSDSLVVPQAQRGFRVSPMSLADIEDLTRTRTLLECAAFQDAMKYGDERWEAEVVGAYHRLSRAQERLAREKDGWSSEWEDRNRAFHQALISACPSRWILRFQSVLYGQTERYWRLSTATTPVAASVHEEHRQIFDAAMKRDGKAGARLLAQHIQHSLTVIKGRGVPK